eukprot:5855830-Pyramimonas_sp.AAC.1
MFLAGYRFRTVCLGDLHAASPADASERVGSSHRAQEDPGLDLGAAQLHERLLGGGQQDHCCCATREDGHAIRWSRGAPAA